MEDRGTWARDLISTVYDSFLMRDLLGFVAPGFIGLMASGYLLSSPSDLAFFDWVSWTLRGERSGVIIAAVVGISYMVGLLLQSVHFGLVDFLADLFGPNWERGADWLFLWPIKAVSTYIRDGEISEDWHEVSRVSGAIIFSDRVVARGSPLSGIPDRIRHALTYHERLGVLTVARGNRTIGGLLALLAAGRSPGGLEPWIWVVGLGVLGLNYIESWRTWWFRNRRLEMYAHPYDETRTIKE